MTCVLINVVGPNAAHVLGKHHCISHMIMGWMGKITLDSITEKIISHASNDTDIQDT